MADLHKIIGSAFSSSPVECLVFFLNNHILCSSFFFVFVALPKVIDFLFSFLDEEKILTSLENSNGSALK